MQGWDSQLHQRQYLNSSWQKLTLSCPSPTLISACNPHIEPLPPPFYLPLKEWDLKRIWSEGEANLVKWKVNNEKYRLVFSLVAFDWKTWLVFYNFSLFIFHLFSEWPPSPNTHHLTPDSRVQSYTIVSQLSNISREFVHEKRYSLATNW